ncbi:MAG: alpha/beta fold hydrolase [Chloroflexi bacterium]|nr:alpha/beta fold hydrolase [Chloroflexota bacterium]MDA1239517.1 alpha/beta fold hydrolase [Chloroflexota bacterium]MQC25727.1 alpha/beta fold hydrolase [Chloroflexota bacterium]MQC47600.1 alpha/beta fold hydrolase [Chloroflexota bacterium]
MPHVELPTGIRIRYDERGPSDARPLVLAHGFTAGLEMWFPQMHVLSQDYRLITWDARGHGGSSAPGIVEEYTMPALAEDLRGLLEALDAVDGAIIGGMSFGGQIALQYTVDHPSDVHALILSDSTTRGPQPPEEPRTGEVWDWAGDPGLEGGRHAMRTRPDLSEAIKDLDVATLVIVGTLDDMILPALHRLDGLPRSRVVRLDGCYHGTSGQRPHDWNDQVLRFLRDVEAGAPLGEDEIV